MHRYTIALAAVAVAAAAHAQTGRWTKEPSAVFGMPFGQPFDLDNLRHCGGVAADSKPAKYSFCRMTGGFSQFGIAGFPQAAFSEGSLVLGDDNVPEALLITSPHENYREIRAILVERYGSPTSQSKGVATNAMGAKFSNEVSIWIGKTVMLTLRERAGEVGQSAAIFQYIPSAAAKVKKTEERRKQDASKM